MIHGNFPSLSADLIDEIFLCEFPFTSGAASKVRPSLVLFDFQMDALICRVTSVEQTGPLDLKLSGWQSVGFLRPSVVRFDRLVTAERTLFLRRLGVLSKRHQDAVRYRWN